MVTTHFNAQFVTQSSSSRVLHDWFNAAVTMLVPFAIFLSVSYNLIWMGLILSVFYALAFASGQFSKLS